MFHETRSHAGIIDLGHALRAGWVEFWYQPKIDLRQNQLVGVEMLARARHPFHGMLSASVLLAGADERSLSQLSAYAINSALKFTHHMLRHDIRLPVTLNVPVAALHSLPSELIIGRELSEDWPGLIFDVDEDEILKDLKGLARIASELASCGMKLAADGFGRNLSLLMQSPNSAAMQEQIEDVSRRLIEFRNVSVFELKLDRSLVRDCASDSRRAAICKIVIELIQYIGSTAVAVGLENAADASTLRDLGCNIGQGNYFCQPMPLEHFVGILKSSRSSNRKMLQGSRFSGFISKQPAE